MGKNVKMYNNARKLHCKRPSESNKNVKVTSKKYINIIN